MKVALCVHGCSLCEQGPGQLCCGLGKTWRPVTTTKRDECLTLEKKKRRWAKPSFGNEIKGNQGAQTNKGKQNEFSNQRGKNLRLGLREGELDRTKIQT
jgi:hypothetical protein